MVRTTQATTGAERVFAPHQDAVRVLIAEDYSLVRHGLRSLFESAGFFVTGDADEGRAAIRLAEQTQPDIAVVDLILPGLSGLDTAREIVRVSAQTRCVLLTRHFDEETVLSALRAGIAGYAVKSVPSEILLHGIEQVRKGGVYLCPCAARVLADAYIARRESADDPLTSREREVLLLIAEGCTTKDIAQSLNLSPKTAESHRIRIMTKLKIRTTAGLVRYAVRRGLVDA